MSIWTQLAPAYFFPAAGAGLVLARAAEHASPSDPNDPLEQAVPHHRAAYTGAGLLGGGFLTYVTLNGAPELVKRFHVDAAERISAHMIARNWPGRGAVAGAVLAGLGMGAIYSTTDGAT
jgi:hypothetical protein